MESQQLLDSQNVDFENKYGVPFHPAEGVLRLMNYRNAATHITTELFDAEGNFPITDE